MADPLPPGSPVSIPTLPIDPRTAASFMLASFVVQIYDWLLTSAAEVDRIWLMEWNAFTLLWFFARYVPVASRVLGVVGSFKLSWNPQVRVGWILRCITGQYIAGLCTVFENAAHFLRRILASALPFMLWLAEVGMNLIPIVRPSSIAKPVPGIPGCSVSAGPGETRLLSITIAFGVAFDVTTSLLVIARCMSYWRISVRGPLLSMLLVHSAGYFAIVLVLGAVNLVLVLGAVDNTTLTIFWLMLASTIPSITVNRMLLSLRAFSTPAVSAVSPRTLPSAELRSIRLTRAFGLNTMMNSFNGLHGQHPGASPSLPAGEEQIELQGAASS